jgi:hypothetical protein
MANVDKFTRMASGHLCSHFERGKDENSEYIKFGNQNIDRERSHQNYNLAPDRPGGQIEFIRRRTSEVKCLKRDDVNVMCSWVVTLPQGFSREKEFFKESYRFLSERYGKDNVVSAYVHMDEKQPHMHFAFVPVVVGKNGKEKVSAKELLTKMELKRFHPDLKNSLEHALDQEVPILNGATVNGNRTVSELKSEETIVRARDAAEKAMQEAEKVKGKVTALRNQEIALRGDLRGLQAKILTANEVNALKGRKTLTGALKGVSFEEFESVRRTAQHVESMEAKKNKAEERAKKAEARIAIAEERVRKALTERPSFLMQAENNKLKARLARVESWLKNLVELLPEPFRIIVQNILCDRNPFLKEQRQQRDHDRGR